MGRLLPVYFGFFRISYTLVLLHAPRLRLAGRHRWRVLVETVGDGAIAEILVVAPQRDLRDRLGPDTVRLQPGLGVALADLHRVRVPVDLHRPVDPAVVAAVALVALAGIAWWLSRPDDTPASGLPTRTVQAGAVEVTLTPLALNASGAVFQVKLDTHTVPLDLDVAASARLRVNDTTSNAGSWDGQGPGDHHREGTLRFTTPAPPEPR